MIDGLVWATADPVSCVFLGSIRVNLELKYPLGSLVVAACKCFLWKILVSCKLHDPPMLASYRVAMPAGPGFVLTSTWIVIATADWKERACNVWSHA
jgi:hypothetical protein